MTQSRTNPPRNTRSPSEIVPYPVINVKQYNWQTADKNEGTDHEQQMLAEMGQTGHVILFSLRSERPDIWARVCARETWRASAIV